MGGGWVKPALRRGRWVSPTLLPELTIRRNSRPFRLDHPPRDIAVDRRIWPIDGSFYQPMLDRIEPTIPHMVVKIGLIADVVFPKPRLPKPNLAFSP